MSKSWTGVGTGFDGFGLSVPPPVPDSYDEYCDWNCHYPIVNDGRHDLERETCFRGLEEWRGEYCLMIMLAIFCSN